MDTTTKYEMDSDIEHDSDDGLPNVKAWGKKKSVYFGTDYVDKDFRKRSGQDEEELAQQEEEEARAIQLRLLEEIKEDDLDLDRLPDVRLDRDETVQKVQIDINSLSKREKLQLLKKGAPELASLVDDFKSSLAQLEKQKNILNYDNVDDIDAYQSSLVYQVYKTKFNLVTRYCMNISFYLLLKSKGKSIGNHPCASNLLDLKKMILTIEKIESKKPFKIMVSEFLGKIEKKEKIIMKLEEEADEDEEIDLRDYDDNNEIIPTPKKRVRFSDDKRNDKNPTEKEEDFDLRDYGDLREKNDDDDEEDEDEDEDFDDLDLEDEEDEEEVKGNIKSGKKIQDMDEKMDEDEVVRRPINYQIAKNKGLTPKKPKEQRNPRVKHRMKYKKAKARRRGQVREPRKEIKKYGGEISGIRTTTVKSLKFK